MFLYWTISALILLAAAFFIVKRAKNERPDYVELIKSVPRDSVVVDAIQNLINRDGAGSWPPRSSYGDKWPISLRAYQTIYFELAPTLAIEEMPWESDSGLQRMQSYRERMRRRLRESIDLEGVKKALNMPLSPQVYNGLFACIAISRHAYRWATIPIVKVAQEEQIVDFPPELDVPWNFLRHRYGVTSPGGNVTSNFYCNYDENDNLIYAFNVGMPQAIRSAEYHFGHIFPAMEKQGLPVYYHMLMATVSFEQNNRREALKHLEQINCHLKAPLKIFFDSLVESKIGHKVWMRYVQGIQGWAAGEVIDGKYVEYDGLSGNQLLLLHCVDAFLGLEQYLPEENTLRYIPQSQRELSAAFRRSSFRRIAEKMGDSEVITEMENIAKQLRLFRAAHRSRATPYLSVPAPERLIMTAGKSVLESDAIKNIKAAIDFLDVMLLKRFQQTR